MCHLLVSLARPKLVGTCRPSSRATFTICDNAKRICRVWPGQPLTDHRGTPDPTAVHRSEARWSERSQNVPYPGSQNQSIDRERLASVVGPKNPDGGHPTADRHLDRYCHHENPRAVSSNTRILVYGERRSHRLRYVLLFAFSDRFGWRHLVSRCQTCRPGKK